MLHVFFTPAILLLLPTFHILWSRHLTEVAENTEELMRNWKRTGLFPAGLIVGVSIAAGAQAAADKPRNIILIGWDGAQRAHLKECLARQELPNLTRLTAEGTLVAIDITRVTDTKAGWAQILSGYEPETSGVYSNGRFRPIPKGLTVFERLEKEFGKRKFVTVAVIGKKGNVGAAGPRKKRIQRNRGRKANRQQQANRQGKKKWKKPPGAKMIVEDGVKYWAIPGEPFFIAQDSMEAYENGLGQDKNVGAKALSYLEKYKDKPFFFFVHVAEVDHKGHKFGENSKQYNDAIISADTWTGKIMDKLKELGLYEKTLIYVTADHGFDEGLKKHSDAPYVFLGTNDPKVIRRGERCDVAPTILSRFGLDLARLDPPLDGISLTEPKPTW
jgi:hypothetical protein